MKILTLNRKIVAHNENFFVIIGGLERVDDNLLWEAVNEKMVYSDLYYVA